ncbi:MAG: class I SAM-dependent methyltransferase [Alphaproteobacteria bacterium]|nr:class I SAM-dependent methyltransferase [Alphaproteobacteria bacterium]
MTVRLLDLTSKLQDYVLSVSSRETKLMARLRDETATMPGAGMQIPPIQGQFLAFLVSLIGARRGIEIGTFTGYSALWVATALPADGKLICCDVNEKTTAVARRYWKEAGVDRKIELRLAPALDTLKSLLASGGAGTFDYVFIDADKENYDAYYERSLALLRQGGLVVFDNMLWGGAVADGRKRDPDTLALKALNAKLHHDRRIDLSLLYIGDGVTLARKR